MTIQEAIVTRHSVRAFKEQPLEEDVVKVLENENTQDMRVHCCPQFLVDSNE